MSKDISSSSSKRLAKNTLLLYLRTLMVMAITLFTSRVILASLGIEDFGTYNAIGGFVALFSMLGGTLVKSTQRFLNFELGKKEGGDINKVFCTGMGIHVAIAVTLLVIFETFGLWFLNCKMNFPDGRLGAANVVFQTSVLAFLLNVIGLPFNAVIIAFERMKAFAFVSLLDAALKLGISYLLFLSDGDRLILYSILLLCLSLLNQLLYVFYCRLKFPNVVKFRLIREKEAYVKQTSFAGFTFLGSVAGVLSNQGINLVLNLFCGVTVNAARAIAIQVQHAVTKFVTDFMTALNPQITKSYAAGELEKSMTLVYRGAKFSYYLVLIFSVPIFFKTSEILQLWLKDYPNYAVIFVQLTLVYALVNVVSHPLITEILSTGKIKANALIIGGIRILSFPISYVLLKLNFAPYCVYVVLIVIDTISIFTRLYIIRSITGTKIILFLKNVVLYVAVVTIAVAVVNVLLSELLSGSLLYSLLYVVVSVGSSSIIVWFLGMSRRERLKIGELLLKRLKR